MSSNVSEHSGEDDKPFTPDEIVALKELAAELKKPWKPNYPLIVSVLAFLLSLTTSIISAYTSHRRNINDQVSQLSAAIQTIQDLNLKQVEVHEKYKGTPYANQAGGLIAHQYNNTLAIASDLAFKLGSDASTAALSTVAQGLYGVGDVAGARTLFETALSSARSANDESIALRGLGFIKIRNEGGRQSLQQGQELFLRASNLERKHDGLGLEAALWLKATARAQWAIALAALNCDEARKHFSEAIDLLRAPLDNLDLAQLRGNMEAQVVAGIGGIPSCRPSAG